MGTATATANAQQLSPDQQRFAREHDAVPGVHSISNDRMVFFYHRDLLSTSRWLVDEHGQAVDTAAFHNAAGYAS